MSHRVGLVLTVAVLLLGTGAPAQSQATKQWRRVERSVSLTVAPREPTQPLRLAPNVVTTVVFDTDIDPAEVDVTNLRALFTLLQVQARLLVLRPAVAMPAEREPALVVRFADGAAPHQLTFVLTTDEQEVDSVVDVLRKPVPSEQLEARLVAMSSYCESLEERLAAARKQALPRGLAGALLSEAITMTGVKGWDDKSTAIAKGLKATRLHTFRSKSWLAFKMTLANPANAAPWLPGRARLARLDADGRPLGEVLEAPVQMREARLAPGQSAEAVVQWPWPAGDEAAVYTLEVLDAAGRRGVRWPELRP